MKRIVSLIGFVTILFSSSVGHSQPCSRAAGIILRGAVGNFENEVAFSLNESHCCGDVETGQGGGSLTFFSRSGERTFLELTLGAMGSVAVKSEGCCDEDVDVNGVAPFTVGFRYHLFNLNHPGPIHPFVVAGGGPYWESKVQTRQVGGCLDSNVRAKTRLFPGAYAGGGFFFNLTNWMAATMDVKYHMVNFDPNHEFSAAEMGFGLAFFWGKYSR